MRQHPPSRPTANLQTEKQSLPEVAEDNEIKFQDHEYKIISTPDETQKLLTQERAFKAKLRNNILKMDEEIHRVNQNIKRLEEKQQKIVLDTHAVQKNVNDLKIQALQSEIHTLDHSSMSTNTSNTETNHLNSQSRLRQIEFELKMKKKEAKVIRNTSFSKELSVLLTENKLKGSKNELMTLKWLNSISKLKNQTNELKTVVEMVSDNAPAPLISSSLESIHFQLSGKPEIQRVIEQNEEDIKAKEKGLKDMELGINELKIVLEVKQAVMALISK